MKERSHVQKKAFEMLNRKRLLRESKATTRDAKIESDYGEGNSYINGFIPCEKCAALILEGAPLTDIVKRPWPLEMHIIPFVAKYEKYLTAFFESIERHYNPEDLTNVIYVNHGHIASVRINISDDDDDSEYDELLNGGAPPVHYLEKCIQKLGKPGDLRCAFTISQLERRAVVLALRTGFENRLAQAATAFEKYREWLKNRDFDDPQDFPHLQKVSAGDPK